LGSETTSRMRPRSSALRRRVAALDLLARMTAFAAWVSPPAISLCRTARRGEPSGCVRALIAAAASAAASSGLLLLLLPAPRRLRAAGELISSPMRSSWSHFITSRRSSRADGERLELRRIEKAPRPARPRPSRAPGRARAFVQRFCVRAAQSLAVLRRRPSRSRLTLEANPQRARGNVRRGNDAGWPGKIVLARANESV